MSEPTDEGKRGDYRIERIGKLTIHKIPDILLRLNIEIDKYHPNCAAAIADGPQGDWITKFGSVAAYCGIIMDDVYTAEDIEKIAQMCMDRLVEARTGIIITSKH